jgi:hypothetical protein
VIDVGTHTANFQGHDKEQSKVVIGWELADVRVTIPASEKGPEKTFLQKVSNTYTASLDSRAALRQHLDAWRGRPFTPAELKGFQLKALLGQSCMIQIMHEDKGGKTYANIVSIMAMPAGLERPKREAPIVFFDMDARTPLPEGLPPWVINKIAESPEWKERYASRDASDFSFGTAAPGDPPAEPAETNHDEPPAGEMSGLEEAVIEGELRKLAAALGKAGPAFEVRLGTAKRRGTLRELLEMYQEMAQTAATPPAAAPAGVA